MASNNLDAELQDMLKKLTEEHGGGGGATSVITLTGENTGAAMAAGGAAEAVEIVDGDEEGVLVSACTNSNYQAVNNSMVVAGSCAVRDPGVHVVVVEHVADVLEEGEEEHVEKKGGKKRALGSKKK